MMTLPNAQFSIPTRVRFGFGEITSIGECLKEIEAKKPLVVTDPGMLGTTAYEKLTSALDAAGVDWKVFGEVKANPNEDNIDLGTARFRDGVHDSMIAFGGGSAIDAAKAIAMRDSFEGPLQEFGDLVSPELPFPGLIAIPTTSGTGSEVGRATVVTLRSTGHKSVLVDPRLMPEIALLDPELTFDLPPSLTAATGMDALTHCLESYVSNEFHPVCDAIALGGIELVANNLATAVREGHNAEARGNMMLAAMMGAIAFQKDLGSAHAMAHPLSTISGVQHGLANAIVLPTVMRFNLESVAARYAKVATLFDPKNVLLSENEAALAAIDAVAALGAEVGIPATLAEAGVREKDLPALAKAASEDGCRLTNPRPCGLPEFERLFRDAFHGN